MVSDAEMASPSRRSSRRKARVSYDENKVKIHQEEKRRLRRKPPPKKRHKQYESSSEDESSSSSPDEEEEPVTRKPPAKKRKPAASNKGGNRGPASDRTCPHCDQVCSSKAGLKYHIGKPKRNYFAIVIVNNAHMLFYSLFYYLDHYVCCPELNPEKNAKKGKKRAASSDPDDYDEDYKEDAAPSKPKAKGRKKRKGCGKTKYKKVRGPVEARTCPQCKRVFTSVLGRDYHVNNKVCITKKPSVKTSTASGHIAFPTLEQGSQFVTPFGVVEVVSDNRAAPIPQAAAPEKPKIKRNTHLRHQKGSVAIAIKTRVQRGWLSEMYQQKRVTQRGVWKACFGGDPRIIAAQGKKPVPVSYNQSMRLDPPGPEGSFPDRIVECVLIPDERDKFVADDSDDDKSMELAQDASAKSPYGMKLFLRRRTLTEPYVASSTVYKCEDCGGAFTSKVGYNYHTRSEVCITKAKKLAAANQKFLESVEEKAIVALKQQKRRITRPERKKSRKNVPVYPQVWLSLGFKFVAQKPLTKPSAVSVKEEKPEPLDDVLHRLKNELRRERDRSLGAMYPQVFDGLQFRKMPPKWKIIEEQEEQVKRNEALARKKRMRELERQNKSAPPPPIVDIQVLADEADAGRYPSIKRHSGEHEDFCSICKHQGGNSLLQCDFCSRSVHLPCIRQKHTIKDPEPQDDIMCHMCIQYIQARRNRAEKRRIQKQKTALKKSGQELLVGSGGESEYHDVAALGHELRDLTELIRDAQGRLRQSIGVSKMNDARRSMLA